LEEVIKPAELSKNPRSIQLLWIEYKVGLNGRKPAQQFTSAEKNVNKAMAQKYSRRNNVWLCIQRIANAGCTSDAKCMDLTQARRRSPSRWLQTRKNIKAMVDSIPT